MKVTKVTAIKDSQNIKDSGSKSAFKDNPYYRFIEQSIGETGSSNSGEKAAYLSGMISFASAFCLIDSDETVKLIRLSSNETNHPVVVSSKKEEIFSFKNSYYEFIARSIQDNSYHENIQEEVSFVFGMLCYATKFQLLSNDEICDLYFHKLADKTASN